MGHRIGFDNHKPGIFDTSEIGRSVMAIYGARQGVTHEPDSVNARQVVWHPEGFDQVFVTFAVTIYSGALMSPLRQLRGEPPLQVGTSDPFSAGSQILLLVVLVCLLAHRRERIMRLLGLVTPSLLIVALSVVSVLWSDYPLAGLRRSINLTVCVMFGVYAYDALGPHRLVNLILRLASVGAVASLAVYVALPEIGRDSTVEYSNAMRGVFTQKNELAEFMLLGITCCIYRFLETRQKFRFILYNLLFVCCIVLCRSITALLIATVVLVASGWFILAARPRSRLVFGFLLMSGGAIVVMLFLSAPDEVFEFLGRDSNLTGRLPLWQLVFQAITNHPLFGYGYAGFWNIDSLTMRYLWLKVGWPAPGSHNGFLDVMLEIGIVGLGLYLWLWIRVIQLAAKAWRAERQPIAAWILLFMLGLILLNLDEGSIPWANLFTAITAPALITLEVWNEGRRLVGARSNPVRISIPPQPLDI